MPAKNPPQSIKTPPMIKATAIKATPIIKNTPMKTGHEGPMATLIRAKPPTQAADINSVPTTIHGHEKSTAPCVGGKCATFGTRNASTGHFNRQTPRYPAGNPGGRLI